MYNFPILLFLPLLANGFSIGTSLQPRSAVQNPFVPEIIPATCDCTGTKNAGQTGWPYICHDSRLGPRCLPRKYPLLSLVSDYDRFGSLTPGQFLAKWTDPKSGRFTYPPHEGFSLDVWGEPILGNMTLKAGTKVDRFGGENGKYVSAADAPYNQRSLPPSSLNTPPNGGDFPNNYHIYNVTKDLNVTGGPISPWFGQPGLGAQFYIGATGNISQLVEWGILKKVNKAELVIGPGSGSTRCGL